MSKIEELETHLSFYTGPDRMASTWWRKLSILTAEAVIESQVTHESRSTEVEK